MLGGEAARCLLPSCVGGLGLCTPLTALGDVLYQTMSAVRPGAMHFYTQHSCGLDASLDPLLVQRKTLRCNNSHQVISDLTSQCTHIRLPCILGTLALESGSSFGAKDFSRHLSSC